jgi:hypothetical protein
MLGIVRLGRLAAGRRRRLAHEVDLEAGDRVQEPVRQRGTAHVQTTVGPMHEDQVSDAPVAHYFLHSSGDVRGLASDYFRAEVRGVVEVGLQILLPVARGPDARRLDGNCQQRRVEGAGDRCSPPQSSSTFDGLVHERHHAFGDRADVDAAFADDAFKLVVDLTCNEP